MFLIIISVVLLFICLLFLNKKPKIDFLNKNVLVLGGSSGLGLAISKLLKAKGAFVTIGSRKPNNNGEFNTVSIDVTDYNSFANIPKNFEFIFCCPGISKPGYFKDLDIKTHRETMDLNYFGTLNALKYFSSNNKRPLSFIMISSTLSLYTFPGYSSYSPSKAALNSLFESVVLEMKKLKVDLYIYYVSTITSPGYEKENKTKPKFTFEIEGKPDEKTCSSEFRAKTLIEQMRYNKRICSDLNTRLLMIKSEIYNFIDFLLFPVSFLIYPFWKFYVKKRFMKLKDL